MASSTKQKQTTAMVDLPYRSLLKAISWRMSGTVDTIVLAWLFTGKISQALSIGGMELFTKTFLYYLHERAWNRCTMGRKPLEAPEYEV